MVSAETGWAAFFRGTSHTPNHAPFAPAVQSNSMSQCDIIYSVRTENYLALSRRSASSDLIFTVCLLSLRISAESMALPQARAFHVVIFTKPGDHVIHRLPAARTLTFKFADTGRHALSLPVLS